jgi:putative endonuclease
MTEEKKWWLYLLQCENNKTYTGIAVDVEQRFKNHQTGKGAKFTRMNKPIKILGAQPFPDRSSVSKAETQLKKYKPEDKYLWASEWVWNK